MPASAYPLGKCKTDFLCTLLSTDSKPTVLKYDMPVEAKDSASSEVVITAAKGWPFPIGLPKVTMSGTTSKEKHSYDLQATVHVLYTPQLLTLWTIGLHPNIDQL